MKNAKWSTEPSADLVKYTDQLKPGSVLDLGGSDGVNAIYLVKKGFNVTSVDNDSSSTAKLEGFAIKHKLEINAVDADLNTYIIDRNYANVISFWTFHFLHRTQGERLLENAQAKTEKSGLNIIAGFTNVGSFNANLEKFYFADDYLLEKYEGWEIIEYKKDMISTKSKLEQEAVIFVARKI